MLKNMHVARFVPRKWRASARYFLASATICWHFSYRVSGAMSAPLGQAMVPPSILACRKKSRSLRGRKNGSTLQVFREINDSSDSIIKNDQETIAFFVLNLFDLVQIPHGSPQSNGSIFLISLEEVGSLNSQAEFFMGQNKNLPRRKMRSRAIAFRWFLARHLVGLV